MTQTRTFYLALQRTSVEADALSRVALWEPGLDVTGAAELGERYFGRWGLPMESPAWASYQAVSILHRSVVEANSTQVQDLVAHLESDDSTFDVAKGVPVRFDAMTHQLLQPLYLVRVAPEADELADVEAVIDGVRP